MSQFPNYESYPQSPKLANIGLEIVLSGKTASMGQSIVLHGAYYLTDKLFCQFFREPLTATMIIVMPCDEAGGRIFAVRDGHNLIMIDDGSIPSPTARIGGYFNIDLLAVPDVISRPGRYWVMACLGEFVSQRIFFEIK